jgi:hypothetical protein
MQFGRTNWLHLAALLSFAVAFGGGLGLYFAVRHMTTSAYETVAEPPKDLPRGGFGQETMPPVGAFGTKRFAPATPMSAPALSSPKIGTAPKTTASAFAAGISLPPHVAVRVASTRKLIRNTWLTLKVSDVPKVAQQVRQIAEQLNGYIAHAAQSRSPDGTWHATMTVRVPSDRYFEALSRLQQLGQVDDLREQVQDVTEEFVDLQARVRVLKRSEEHLMELLKRSGKISELMQVERELAQRRSEIEMLEGRLRYLTHQTTFSTIQVTLDEFRARPVPERAFSVAKIFADAFRSVVLILQGALVVAIWVLVFGIFWLPLLLLARWLVKRAWGAMKGVATSGSQ